MNDKQQYLFDMLVDAAQFTPVFVSGSAGTGKSSLLLALRDHWRDQQKIVFVTAFTNMAARNIDGRTCHSLFGFDFDLNLTNKEVGVPNCLIIDEISTVPAKVLDGIDYRLRESAGRFDVPFGGVNVIAFGDCYQLPPVESNASQPSYEADVWSDFCLYELTENMRQSEQEFIDNLNLLRVGSLKCLTFFDSMVIKSPLAMAEKTKYTSLVSTHREAEAVNLHCYNFVFPGKETILTTTSSTLPWHSKYKVYNKQQESVIFKTYMRICCGARVMITHTTQDFCNGDVGEVVDISDSELRIRREYDNRVMRLDTIQLYFDSVTKGQLKMVTGYPISYGWALTIHKAQGMTVKNLIVYPRCIFAEGQAYVALSRVTHSNGLKLMGRVPESAVKNMDHVKTMYQNMTGFTENVIKLK